MFQVLVDIFQTIAILGLFVFVLINGKNIIKNAETIKSLADGITNWVNEKTRRP